MIGCLMVLFYALRIPTMHSLALCIDVWIILALTTVVSLVLTNIQNISYREFVWVGLVSFCLAFMAMEIGMKIAGISFLFHPSFILIFVLVIIFLGFRDKKKPFRTSLRIWMPVALIPLFSFVSDEIFLILRSRGISLLSDFHWLFSLVGPP